MKKYMRQSSRQAEYYEYLQQHIRNVVCAFDDYVYPVLRTHYEEFDIDLQYLSDVYRQLQMHDSSKFNDEEFYPYLQYFYPEEGIDIDDDLFDEAWLHHQNINPHHWQYWVLIQDDGDTKVLDMPLNYIIEMLCDWSSFQYADKGDAHTFYDNNKDKMQLSKNTKDIISKLFDMCPGL